VTFCDLAAGECDTQLQTNTAAFGLSITGTIPQVKPNGPTRPPSGYPSRYDSILVQDQIRLEWGPSGAPLAQTWTSTAYSWDQASSRCASAGMELCGAERYCSETNEPLITTTVDSWWAPTKSTNTWIQITANPSNPERCKAYIGSPSWGFSTDTCPEGCKAYTTLCCAIQPSDLSKYFKFFGVYTLHPEVRLSFNMTLKDDWSTSYQLLIFGQHGKHQIQVQVLPSRMLEMSWKNAGGGTYSTGALGAAMSMQKGYVWEIAFFHEDVVIWRDKTELLRKRYLHGRPQATDEPLYVGDTYGLFSLSGMMVSGNPPSFSVRDSQPPQLLSSEPASNQSTVTLEQLFTLDFNKPIRAGLGSITVGADSVSFNDLTFSSGRHRVEFRPRLIEKSDASLRVPSDMLRSLGSWNLLLKGYIPTSRSPVFSSAADNAGCLYEPIGDETSCYLQCRTTTGCTAFKVWTSEMNVASGCCLYTTYDLTHGAFVGVVADNTRFYELVSEDLGEAFAGIAGPDAKVTGTVTISGIDEATFWGTTSLQSSFMKAIASSATSSTLAVTENMVTTSRVSSRRLLSVSLVTYSIQLTPAQATAAGTTANALAIAMNPANGAFLSAFRSAAEAVGALTNAMAQQINIGGTTPTVLQGLGAFQFEVKDTTSPYVVAYDPPQGSTGAQAQTKIHLTFSEAVQAGTGDVILVQQDTTQHLDISSANVEIVGKTVSITPRAWLQEGLVTIQLPFASLQDSPNDGVSLPNNFAGLLNNTYMFEVEGMPKPPVMDRLQLGRGFGCTYVMTKDWHSCPDFHICSVFVKPQGKNCGSTIQVRTITYEAAKKITEYGARIDNGDGSGVAVNYAGGQHWPEFIVTEF